MSNKQCPYKLLGVESNADTKTIKQAYRKLMMKFHEDRVTNKVRNEGKYNTAEGNKRIEEAKEMSSALNIAENILTDTTKYKTDRGNSYTKRETYDKFGNIGLESLKEGNEPAKSKADSNLGKYSWKEAARTFGGEKNVTDSMSDEELMGGNFNSRRTKRSVKDILHEAKQNAGNEFQEIEELLNTPQKPIKKDSNNKNSSISDITDKLGDLFNKAKETVEDFIPEKQSNTPQNSAELASKLQTIAEEIKRTNGQLSPMLQKAIIQELAEIVNDLQEGNPQNKSTMVSTYN